MSKPISKDRPLFISLFTGKFPSMRRDVFLFCLLGGMGSAASYFSVNIPNTDVYFDVRWAFGFMGFAVFKRWGWAWLLASLLALAGPHRLPLAICFLGNMIYAIPALVTVRLVHGGVLSPVGSLMTYATGWLLLVFACYQLYITPGIWGFIAVLKGEPILEAMVSGWAAQPFLVEALLVGIVSGAGMTVLRSTRELRQSRHELAITLDSIGDGVIVADAGGRVTRMNPAARSLTGWPSDGALGRPLAEVFPLADSRTMEPVESPADRVVREGAVVAPAKPAVLLARNGIKRVISESAAPLHETDGRLMGTVTVFRDITEQKRMEDERREYEARIQQMQKMESIGLLAGGIAHDLNNLLSPILGYGEMILVENAVADRDRGRLEQMVSAGYRARDLVRQLLAFSRKQPLEMKAVNANQVVLGVEKLLRRTLREDIEIRISLAPELPAVRADVGQMEQVIMNLASNAQDAMPRGGTLTIESRVVELDEEYARHHQGVRPGPFVMLAMSDTGKGMGEEIRERIFEPFFTTKERGKGTGLGLATVYGIVKQHGGNIWVYSEHGQGSAFKCYFPVADGCEPVSETASPEIPGDLRGSETVLVVEDDDAVRTMTVSVLEEQGYTVLSARDGRACLELVSGYEGSIHILFTDVVMPGMNGRELFQSLLPGYPDMRVIYVSGYTDNVIAHHGVLDEGIHFIQKPFSVRGLAVKVREVLDSGHT